MSEKKKQHIVPKVYLKWFCNNKWLLNFYDRKTWKYKEQKPENVWWIKHFYTIVWAEWEKDFTIEDYFSNEIENKIEAVKKVNMQNEITASPTKMGTLRPILIGILRYDICYGLMAIWPYSPLCGESARINCQLRRKPIKAALSWLKSPPLEYYWRKAGS